MRRALAAYLGLLALMAGLAAVGAVAVFQASGPSDAIESAADEHAYSVVSWELRHFPGKWLYKIRHAFTAHDQSEDEDTIRRYFALVEEIAGLERDANAGQQLQDAEVQRAGLGNGVEEIIEGRITQLLEDQGLAMEPPLFTDLGLVFPPVDFEFDLPPRVLAVSPRSHIELDRSYLLEPGLDLSAAAGIEREAEAANTPDGGGVSALVIPSGGLATYPSVVSQLDSYGDLIDTATHEWIHQYLAFFPLGGSYFSSSETRTLNESVANIGGHELARLYMQRYGPAPTAPAPAQSPSPSAAAAFDFTQAMRALRRQVEDLLAQGRVNDAESLMDRKRVEFQAQGYYIRRLNQAYFAFHGFYADSPGSIDPIGPKLQTLLQQGGSPGQFLRLASGITSVADLDELLARRP